MSESNYLIAAATLPEQLERRVRELVAEGWEPVGGVTVTGEHQDRRYLQAMVYRGPAVLSAVEETAGDATGALLRQRELQDAQQALAEVGDAAVAAGCRVGERFPNFIRRLAEEAEQVRREKCDMERQTQTARAALESAQDAAGMDGWQTNEPLAAFIYRAFIYRQADTVKQLRERYEHLCQRHQCVVDAAVAAGWVEENEDLSEFIRRTERQKADLWCKWTETRALLRRGSEALGDELRENEDVPTAIRRLRDERDDALMQLDEWAEDQKATARTRMEEQVWLKALDELARLAESRGWEGWNNGGTLYTFFCNKLDALKQATVHLKGRDDALRKVEHILVGAGWQRTKETREDFLRRLGAIRYQYDAIVAEADQRGMGGESVVAFIRRLAQERRELRDDTVAVGGVPRPGESVADFIHRQAQERREMLDISDRKTQALCEANDAALEAGIGDEDLPVFIRELGERCRIQQKTLGEVREDNQRLRRGLRNAQEGERHWQEVLGKVRRERNDRLRALREVRDTQCADGTWNHSRYQHGMANGLILAAATMDGTTPEFLDPPEEWLEDRNAD